MKTVLMFDTSIATLNIGDEIINKSIRKNWPEIFDKNYILTMPTHTPSFYNWQNCIVKKNNIYANADYKFLCGTNILYTNMLRPEPAWNLFLNNTKIARDTVCLGVGIGRNSKKVNLYTKLFYNKVLSKKFTHSVRDDAAKVMLENMGFKAVNTGCPTLWGLTSDFCETIPRLKSRSAIITLTSYQPSIKDDIDMINIVLKNYDEVYFWPQSIKDINYIESLNIKGDIVVIPPNLESYENILNTDIDYIGNRLHGGIFAMQHKCRSIIIGIDYRVSEIKKKYSIPAIMRNEIQDELDSFINSAWNTRVTGLDFNIINQWKNQFI